MWYFNDKIKQQFILLIACCFAISHLSKAQTVTGESEVFQFNLSSKPAQTETDVAKPKSALENEKFEIQITQPAISSGAIEITEPSIDIVGKLNYTNGIYQVEINKFPAEIASDGSFRSTVLLAYGTNIINIVVHDIYQNSKTRTISITRPYSQATNITEPNSADLSIDWQMPDEREFNTSGDQIELKACIETKSKIKEINIYQGSRLISSQISSEAHFQGDCNYYVNHEVQLHFGRNNFRLEVITENEKQEKELDINFLLTESNYYALLVGVEKYDDPNIPNLDQPIKDAKSLKKLLLTDYTFTEDNIFLLENPTKADIIGTLHRLRSVVQPSDNFIIFYAGHGIWDEGMNTGYWLPKDADKENPVNWLPNTDLTNYLSAIKSKHTLLIADACFSGGIFKTRSAFNNEMVIEKLYQLPSRKAMTSGTLQEVPDKSVFVKYLLKRLDDNNSKYLTSEQLFTGMRMAIINNSPTVPQYGTIQNTGDEGGDFIFIRKK
ncbi:MAG: hypothetical protein GVY19_04540 [Bacteroidetes bacterium]|jgi:hypothetical protein|nr:hypothetical protein [Bacteroidota bacterium]